jgi:ribokinase
MKDGRARVAVIGHVEHVTLGRIDVVPSPGDILHMRGPRMLAAGGGAITFGQLARSDAEVHFFTAVGAGEAGREVHAKLAEIGAGAVRHVARREVDHPRVVVVVDPEGHRTIVLTGEPLQPAARDALPWELLATCDAVYFTGADPESLRLARAARALVVTGRRSAALAAAKVAPDVVVGSVADPRENAPLDAYDPPPSAIVLTDGPRPIRVHRPGGVALVDAPPAPAAIVGDYGAGDSFAGALTFFLAHGVPLERACSLAGPYGAAVLAGLDPFELQRGLKAPPLTAPA